MKSNVRVLAHKKIGKRLFLKGRSTQKSHKGGSYREPSSPERVDREAQACVLAR